MKISNAGYNYRHPQSFAINRPLGSGDYILLIVRSEAFFVLNGKRMEASKNCAIVFKKGTPQLYGACGGEFINDWIKFDLSIEDEEIFSELEIPFDTIIPLRETAEFSHYVKSIFMETHSQNLHREKSIERYFDLLLLKLSENILQGDFEKASPVYHALCALRNEIRLAPQNPWTVDFISQKMKMSRSYIQHLYKQFFGISISADIQSSRIEYAKYLLALTNEKISAIAASCGYESDVHFMRIFKKATAMTPSEFRAGANKNKI